MILRYMKRRSALYNIYYGASAVKKVLQMLEGASRARRVHTGFFRHMSYALYLSPCVHGVCD